MPGAVSQQLLRDLCLIRDFLVAQDEALYRLFGSPVRRNPLRIEIMRRVVIRFGLGELQPISYYERACASLGSRSAIQREVHILEETGLVILRKNDLDRRAQILVPSETLVDWYGAQVASIREVLFERARLPEGEDQALFGVTKRSRSLQNEAIILGRQSLK